MQIQNQFKKLIKKKKKTRPISCVQIELTNVCNYYCKFCPQSHGFQRIKGFMPFNMFTSIVEEIKNISNSINFSFFGEPLLHPEFIKITEYLKNRNFSVVMNTNLSYTTKEIFHKLIEMNLNDLRLSIDAFTAETYDQVRPIRAKNNYLTLDGNTENDNNKRFETIIKKAEYWFSIPNHTPTRHVYTINSINKKEIKDFVCKWLPLLNEKDIILTKNVLSYGGKINDQLIFQNPCNIWDLNMLTVDWQGNVSPCNLDTGMELIIGNVKNDRLIDLLNNDKWQELKNLSLQKQISPCKTCIDSNNWTKNIAFRQGDVWDNKYFDYY